jgi:urease accessory protein UreF
LSDLADWWNDPITQKVWKRISARQEQLARAIVLGAAAAPIEDMRVMAGEYKGITLAMTEFQYERREDQ